MLFTTCNKTDKPKPGKSSCRLLRWQGLDDGYLRTLHYNEKGLLDEWHETNLAFNFNQLSTFEYDSHKRVSKVKFYDQNVLISSAVPVYESGRITKEIWYVNDTETIEDTVVNTYNSKGQIVKREPVNIALHGITKVG